MKKTFLLLSLVFLLVVLCVCAQAEGTGLLPRLPRTVTEYGIDFETEEWAPVRTWDYTYENGYPVSIDMHELDADMHSITTFTYTFDGGVPAERKTYDGDGNLLSVTEYRNGCVYNVREQSSSRNAAQYYQYANGDEYFTMLLWENRVQDPDDPEIRDFSEEVDAVSVTAENGLLVKTVNTGMYANWGGDTEKEWLRFSGTYTAEYDEDGIAVLASAQHREGPSGIESRMELTKADGAVTEGTCYSPTTDGGWWGNARFTFTYTDIETTPARYAQMINSFLMGSESSYYNYNWY